MVKIEEIVSVTVEAFARRNPAFAERLREFREEAAVANQAAADFEAALDELVHLPENVALATARVAMARLAAPEPQSVGHWGMHA